ncbi:MAG TPA: 2-hydroxychromene-2-carboxylate isomerase [Rhizomicrobium sp.]|nr:2-hydroxychromene-2-carboxylate isomerase [Rhizomicrobium sp.]
MKPRVEFLFDFGSPNAYLAHQVIPEIEARTGVKFAYVPVLLGGIFKLTNNASPMVAFGPVKNKLPYEMLETQRFIRRHNIVKYKFNPHFPINTLALMRGAVAAELEGILPSYVEAGFHFMWEEPRKMDDPETFRAALAEAGLPADRLLELSQSPEVKKRLMDNTEQAVARGAFGIPTFFVGGEIFFGKDRLGLVEEEIARVAQGAA